MRGNPDHQLFRTAAGFDYINLLVTCFAIICRCFYLRQVATVNPLECKGNYSATSNNVKLVHCPLMGGLLRLVQRGGDWAGPQPAQAGPSSLYQT